MQIFLRRSGVVLLSKVGSEVLAGNINQKLKLLYLMKILIEQTDAENSLTIRDIIDELWKYEIRSERKSIYKDIKLLQQFGLDIICKKSITFSYYIGNRDFELPELKLLVDAVQSSNFITKKKSNDLIKKIENLTSRHLAKQLHRQVFISDRVKAINETIYYNVDTLHNAITQNLQVSFKYFEYTIDKKKQYRKNGEDYIVSPYALSWVDDNYYLISHYLKRIDPLYLDNSTYSSIYLMIPYFFKSVSVSAFIPRSS